MSEWSPPSECRAYADGSRSFDLPGLAPGRWVLLVRDEQAEVDVVAGDRSELTLDGYYPLSTTVDLPASGVPDLELLMVPRAGYSSSVDVVAAPPPADGGDAG